MKLLDKLQKAGIEKIIKKKIKKYAEMSGVEVDIKNLEIIFFDNDYKVRIPIEYDDRSKRERFMQLVKSDPYLHKHV